jgi:hypothetical protein
MIRLVLPAATFLIFALSAAPAALAQRTSSLEVGAFILAGTEHVLTRRNERTPQACRDACLADRRCVAWDWTPDEPRENCALLAGLSSYTRLEGSTTVGGLVSEGPQRSAFPLPRPGSSVLFRLSGASDRYSRIEFLGTDSDTYRVARTAWEGRRDDRHPHNHVATMAGDEPLDDPPGKPCTRSASAAQLRDIGRSLSYKRTCTDATHMVVTTVQRRVAGRTTIEVPAGRFDVIEVERLVRQVNEGNPWGNPDYFSREVSETRQTRYWVERLGLYVKDVQQLRIVSRDYSAAWRRVLEEDARQHRYAFPPASTDWDVPTEMVAIEVR